MIPTDIIFIADKKNYDAYMDKMKVGDEHKLYTQGRTTSFVHHRHGHRIVIGINAKKYDVYQVKGLIVHEIAHAVDFIMSEHGFEGMEFRAYLQQYIYIEIMKYYDSL
jgi:hypothetical protein